MELIRRRVKLRERREVVHCCGWGVAHSRPPSLAAPPRPFLFPERGLCPKDQPQRYPPAKCYPCSDCTLHHIPCHPPSSILHHRVFRSAPPGRPPPHAICCKQLQISPNIPKNPQTWQACPPNQNPASPSAPWQFWHLEFLWSLYLDSWSFAPPVASNKHFQPNIHAPSIGEGVGQRRSNPHAKFSQFFGENHPTKLNASRDRFQSLNVLVQSLAKQPHPERLAKAPSETALLGFKKYVFLSPRLLPACCASFPAVTLLTRKP